MSSPVQGRNKRNLVARLDDILQSVLQLPVGVVDQYNYAGPYSSCLHEHLFLVAKMFGS